MLRLVLLIVENGLTLKILKVVLVVVGLIKIFIVVVGLVKILIVFVVVIVGGAQNICVVVVGA